MVKFVDILRLYGRSQRYLSVTSYTMQRNSQKQSLVSMPDTRRGFAGHQVDLVYRLAIHNEFQDEMIDFC
jgi:hypothetical protein